MKQKKALVKLAQVRLAINHVLRQRMVKKADDNIKSRYNTSLPVLNMMSTDTYQDRWQDPEFLDMLERNEGSTYVADEYNYLKNIGEVNWGGNIHALRSQFGDVGAGVDSSGKPMFENEILDMGLDPRSVRVTQASPTWDPYYWDRLAVRASLPSGHSNYVSPEEVNKETALFYNRYNGNLGQPHRIEYKSPAIQNRGMNSTTAFYDFPFYPVEGVKYDSPKNTLKDMYKKTDFKY